ncbi:MAG: hypothetical protein ACOCSE_01545 [Chitinivibrionales bacterium]
MRIPGLIAVIVISILVLFAGCGDEVSVEKGDKYKLNSSFKVEAVTDMGDATDGFTFTLPEGTVVEAIYSAGAGKGFFEANIIEMNGMNNFDKIEQVVVPSNIRRKEEYVSYSFALPLDSIGTMLEKVE